MTCLRSTMVLGGFLMMVLLTTAETGQVKTTSLKIPPPGYSYMIKNNKPLYNIKLVPESTPDHQTDHTKFFNPYGRTRPSKTFFQLAKTRTETPSIDSVARLTVKSMQEKIRPPKETEETRKESEKSTELDESSKNAEVKVTQVLSEEDESPEHESDEQSKEGDSEEDHESKEEDEEEDEEEEEDSKEEDEEEDEEGSDEGDEKESDEEDEEDSDEDFDKNASTTVKSVQPAITRSKSSSYFVLGSSHRSPNVQEQTTKKSHHHHKAKVHSKGSHKKSHKSSKGSNKSSVKTHQLTKGSTRKNEPQVHKTRLPSTSHRSDRRFRPSSSSRGSPSAVKVNKRVGKPVDTPVVSAHRPSVTMRTGGPRITVAGTQHDFTRTGKTLNRRSN